MRSIAPLPPKLGDTRRFSRFLWFPKTIGRETRWLERAEWEELYCEGRYVYAIPLREWWPSHWVTP